MDVEGFERRLKVAMVVTTVLYLAILGTLGYVAFHFISKWW